MAAVRREPQNINDGVDRVVMWCPDEQLGFLGCGEPVVRQSSSHSNDITDVFKRKFVVPSGRETSGEGFQFGQGEGLHNDERPRFVQRRIVNEGSEPPG